MFPRLILINQTDADVEAFLEIFEEVDVIYIGENSTKNRIAAEKLNAIFFSSFSECVKSFNPNNTSYVVSFNDQASRICSDFAYHFNLRSNTSQECNLLFLDKLQTLKRLSGSGVQRFFTEVQEHVSPNLEEGKRYFCKPRTQAGSLGVVSFVSDSKDVNFAKAFERSRSLAASEPTGFMVEEELVGAEYSADFYILNAKPYLLGIAQKGTTFPDSFVESSHLVGKVLDARIEEELIQLSEVAFHKLHLKNGPSHVEFFVTTNGGCIELTELHCRPGGDNLIELIETSWGNAFLDYFKADLMFATPPKTVSKNRFSWIQYFKQVPNISQIREISPKLKVKLSDRKFTESPRASSDRIGFVTVQGVEKFELTALLKALRSAIEIDENQLDFLLRETVK